MLQHMELNVTRQGGAQIRARRRALDLSQEKLARLVDCSVSSIRFAECDVLVSDRMLARIDEVLSDAERQEVNGEEEPKPGRPARATPAAT